MFFRIPSFHVRVVASAGFPVMCVLTLLLSSTAGAFGPQAHALVAERAQQELTPHTAREVKRLLAAIGAHSMAEVASWADENRDKTTARWHYINFPPHDCHYVRERDCPDGNCLIEAMRTQRAILADRKRSDVERAKALRFVIHLVGDAHQPLHSGRYADRGGNRYQINIDGEGSNLHRLWDSGLARNLPNLRRDVLGAPPLGAKLAGPVAWSESACRMVNRDGFYPSHKPSSKYLHWAAPIFEHQIELAGDRLAMLLEDTLGAKPANDQQRAAERSALIKARAGMVKG